MAYILLLLLLIKSYQAISTFIMINDGK